MGGVDGARGQVAEERLARRGLLLVLDEADGPVGQVLGEVVAVVGRPRRLDEPVVGDEVGRPLVGVAVQEPVVALEAEPEGPVVERAGRALLPAGGEVPLADRERVVARVAQQPGHPGGRPRDAPVVAGEPDGQVGDEAHADPVLVAPGEQAGAGGRAHGGHVEPAVAQPAGGQAVDGGGGDVAAEASELGEAEVVEHDDEDVGGPGRRAGHGRERRPRVPDRLPDHGLPSCACCSGHPGPLPLACATGRTVPARLTARQVRALTPARGTSRPPVRSRAASR